MIYLASRSPRRRELLAQIGVPFELLLFREGARQDDDTDESVLSGEGAGAYVRRVATLKARAAWKRVGMRKGLKRLPVLTADTTVVVGNEILGKPENPLDARRMLMKLSGARHHVFTAVAVAFEQRCELALNESIVTFGPLDEDWVEAYLESGEPFDKAGGYGIQGRAGAFVEKLEGSYTGVMGLPLYETARLLREFGLTVP